MRLLSEFIVKVIAIVQFSTITTATCKISYFPKDALIAFIVHNNIIIKYSIDLSSSFHYRSYYVLLTSRILAVAMELQLILVHVLRSL